MLPQGEMLTSLQNIFLSGGFAQNPYFYKKVKQYTDRQAHIKVQRADNW